MADKVSFEDTLKKLEEAVSRLKSEDVSLEEAIKCYEDAKTLYNECNDILKKAEQTIETIIK